MLKMTMTKIIAVFLTSFLFVHTSLWCQDIFQKESTELYITGGSTLHDWKVTTTELQDITEQLSIDESGSGTIELFTFKVEVAGMDGGRGATMNNKIQKALQSDIHPLVIYSQTEEASYTFDEQNQVYLISSTGIIEMAGTSKEVTVKVEGRLENDLLTLKGSYPLLLSDYNIDPPSAMFGQIQTKNEISIHFNFVYKKT